MAADQYTAAATAEPAPTESADNLDSVSISSTAGHLTKLRHNLLKTITYCLLFSLVGMSDASIGAALPGLTCLARTSEEKATLLLFFHEACVLLMAVFSGFLNRKVSANKILALVSLLVPTSFVLVPQCSSLSAMITIFSLMGTMEGCLEYFCNVLMLSLYRSSSGPFLQAMFFCQSLGALLSPLIIGSFMSGGAASIGEWSNCSLPEELEAAVSESFGDPSKLRSKEGDASLEMALSRVRYPFYTIAVLQIPVMLCTLYLCYKEGWSGQLQHHSDSCSVVDEKSEMREEGPSAYLVLLFASSCALALDGILGSYSSLIYTFSMRAVHSRVDRDKTAYLAATFWGSTLLGRLIGIGLTLKLSTVHVIFMDLAGLLLASIIFIIGQHSVSALFAATVFTGFFISHCMPALLALTEQFVKVTRDRATAIVASAAFGEAVLPIIMAAVMHQIGRSAYPLFHALFVLIAGVLCFFLVNFGFRTKKSEFADSGLGRFMLFGLFSPAGTKMELEAEQQQQHMQLQSMQQQEPQEEDFFARRPQQLA